MTRDFVNVTKKLMKVIFKVKGINATQSNSISKIYKDVKMSQKTRLYANAVFSLIRHIYVFIFS